MDDLGKEVAEGLFPGAARSGPAATPAALASGIKAYLSGGGGVEAARRLGGMARASAADALSIVGAEGLLACVERRVTAGGTASGDQAAANAIALLTAAAATGDARVHARIAGEEPLLRALLLAVARGPPDGARRGYTATALHQLSHTASWEAAARAVDVLPDKDLKAVVAASVFCRWGLKFSLAAVAFLARCARDEAVLRRLLGPAAFLRALAGLMADEAAPDLPRVMAVDAIYGLVSAAKSRGVGDKEAFKPLLKPLMAAYERGRLPGASPIVDYIGTQVAPTLDLLVKDAKLLPSLAADIPRLVAALQGGGPAAISAAAALTTLSTQPAPCAAIVRAGAVSVLVALLLPRDRACYAFIDALANLMADAGGRAALRATDASARMAAMLDDAELCRLSRGAARLEGEDEGLLSLALATSDLSNFVTQEILPASVLLTLATPARVARIARVGGVTSDNAVNALLHVAILRRSNFDAMAASGALRAILDAFVDAGASDRLLRSTGHLLTCSLSPVVGAGFQPDILLPGVDRDCRQALARFLLLPSNGDVLRRLHGLIRAASDGATAAGDGYCPAGRAVLIFVRLGDPGVVGPQLALEFQAFLVRVNLLNG